MQQLRFSAFGAPSDVLHQVEVEAPQPGPGQVRVKLTARPINPADMLNIMGLYGTPPALPAIGGMEGVGIVDALGPEVPPYFPLGLRVYVLTQGTWQNYVCIAPQATIPVPDELPDAVACQLLVNPLSAYLMLEQLGLKPGQWLIQTGASSSLGLMVVQLARQQGIKTINVIRTESHRQTLLDAGADCVINSATEDLVAKVLALTDGRGASAAIDAVAGSLGEQVVTCLTRGATLLIYGVLSGQSLPLNAGQMIFKCLTVKGFWVGDWLRTAQAATRQKAVEAIANLLASGQLKAPVAATFPLHQFQDALAACTTPGRSGKVVLVD